MRFWLSAGLILVCLLSEVQAEQVITVAADPWCPYNCEPDASAPGFAIEILREAMAFEGIKVRYQLMPWSRALRDAQQGRIDGVVATTAKTAEKNHLHIGLEPVGSARFCLFVAADRSLRDQGAVDLESLQNIGLVADYDYGLQLNSELARPQIQNRLTKISGNKASERLIQMLQSHRIQGFIENEYVTRYTFGKLGLQAAVRSAGCAELHLGYIAFSAQGGSTEDYASKLDAGIQKLRASGRLAEILARYSLSDWQSTL